MKSIFQKYNKLVFRTNYLSFLNKRYLSTKNNREVCRYCKGTCTLICNNCNGIGRTYYGEKEFRCDTCKSSGIVLCKFCDGCGFSFNIF